MNFLGDGIGDPVRDDNMAADTLVVEKSGFKSSGPWHAVGHDQDFGRYQRILFYQKRCGGDKYRALGKPHQR